MNRSLVIYWIIFGVLKVLLNILMIGMILGLEEISRLGLYSQEIFEAGISLVKFPIIVFYFDIFLSFSCEHSFIHYCLETLLQNETKTAGKLFSAKRNFRKLHRSCLSLV